MCKQLIRIAIILLLLFFGIADVAGKAWSGASSITAIQGQSVTMQWTVNLTSIILDSSRRNWTYAKILQVQDGRTTDLMSLQKNGTKTIDDPRYQSRGSDLNLNVSQTGAIVMMTFSLNNLVKSTDQQYYKVMLGFPTDSTTYPNATFLLILIRPHNTSITATPKQTSYCVNDKITITCVSRAYPSASYNLYRNNQLFESGSSSGVFAVSIALTDRVFLCVPYNTVGTGQNRSFQVHVKEPPSISRCKVNNLDQTNITVNEGAKVTFSCEFSGTRPLNVTWTKISQTDKHWNQWNLTIIDVQWSDNGIYRVTVYNGKECNTAVSRTFSLVVNCADTAFYKQRQNSKDIIIACLGAIVAVSLLINVILIFQRLRAKGEDKFLRNDDVPNDPHQVLIPEHQDNDYEEIETAPQTNIRGDNLNPNDRPLPDPPKNQDQSQRDIPLSQEQENVAVGKRSAEAIPENFQVEKINRWLSSKDPNSQINQEPPSQVCRNSQINQDPPSQVYRNSQKNHELHSKYSRNSLVNNQEPLSQVSRNSQKNHELPSQVRRNFQINQEPPFKLPRNSQDNAAFVADAE